MASCLPSLAAPQIRGRRHPAEFLFLKEVVLLGWVCYLIYLGLLFRYLARLHKVQIIKVKMNCNVRKSGSGKNKLC